MSDIRKWMQIMESIPSVFPNQDPKHALIKQDATVMVDPSIGSGSARYMHSTPDGAMVDIKGVARELSSNEFGLPERDYEDPFRKGNDWFHMSAEPDTIGTLNDKPEFRSGDMVKIADVYGSVIGPGMGIFVAYSTSGKECIISFDDKEILVPIENVAAVLEQNAKDNFKDMDNDGNLSPMSLGTQNVKIEEPEMDHRDDFSKWMSAVEEALTSEEAILVDAHNEANSCGCESWNCPTCFPDDSGAQGNSGNGLELGGVELYGDASIDEEENTFVEKPKSGKGVKLGNIVQKTEVKPVGGQNSPLTYGDENLDEELPQESEIEDYDQVDTQVQTPDVSNTNDDDGMFKHDMADKIMNMQSMGLSKDDTHYTIEELHSMRPEDMKSVFSRVMGDIAEENSSKPVKQRHHLDDIEDILNPRQDSLPATFDAGDTAVAGSDETGSMRLPAASRADTQSKVAAIAPSDEMRSWMARINPLAGEGEPELDDTATGEIALRSAEDVPAVISNALQTSGVQNPTWHNVNNLPGFSQSNVRGMGRQLFGMFTNTPLENIQTLANVNGQGPNTDAEMRAVAGWLRNNAEDMGTTDVSHGMAIPGYKPDVKEYRINGVRFHLVRDPMGQYIYAYPDSDAKLAGGQQQDTLPNNNVTPSLRESILKPTLFEQMKWDDEIDEAFIDESTLSKMIGKQKGGQNLVRWLHKRHRLGNDADLQPASFSQRLLWKEFKANPDNFVIVSAENGVAGIKPDKKFIDDRRKEFARKGKEYNPAGDSTLPYQIVAFTDSGEQIDPELLRAPAEDGEDYRDARDPTVMRARMGKHSGKDMQNPYNVFNLLAEQIGQLKTVWITGFDNEKDGQKPGSVERDKMQKRADMKKADTMSNEAAVQKIFMRIKPVLKTLANQAILQINKRAQRYIEGGNFEGAQKVAATGQKLKQLLVSLDTSNPINVSTSGLGSSRELSTVITKAIAQAYSETNGESTSVGSAEYADYATSAAKGNITQLRPILDAVRDQLAGL